MYRHAPGEIPLATALPAATAHNLMSPATSETTLPRMIHLGVEGIGRGHAGRSPSSEGSRRHGGLLVKLVRYAETTPERRGAGSPGICGLYEARVAARSGISTPLAQRHHTTPHVFALLRPRRHNDPSATLVLPPPKAARWRDALCDSWLVFVV